MQFLVYCLCGAVGVSTDYLVYSFSVHAGLWYQAANVLGYLAGTLISFFLNRKVTFGVRDRIAYRLMMFLGVAAVGFVASALMLWVLVDGWGISAYVAKLLTLPVVVAIQFFLNRRITFNVKVQPGTV